MFYIPILCRFTAKRTGLGVIVKISLFLLLTEFTQTNSYFLKLLYYFYKSLFSGQYEQQNVMCLVEWVDDPYSSHVVSCSLNASFEQVKAVDCTPEDVFRSRRVLATAQKGNVVTQTFSAFSFHLLYKPYFQHSSYTSYHARPQQREKVVAENQIR